MKLLGKKLSKKNANLATWVGGGLALVGIAYLIKRLFFTQKATIPAPNATLAAAALSNGSPSGSSTVAVSVSAFSINNGYATNTPYASVNDAYARNADNASDVNTSLTIYAERMETGFTAYSESSRANKLATGTYYYPTTNFVFTVDTVGVMTFVSDTGNKPDGSNMEEDN